MFVSIPTVTGFSPTFRSGALPLGPLPNRRLRSGVALVVTLSAVAMLALLVVAFLSLATRERRANSAFAEVTETRVLTDLPLNLVIAQVRQATETTGGTRTWASQPGMIRVYGQDGSSIPGRTRLERAYKLYSAAEMEAGPAGGGVGVAPAMDAATELPANWISQRAAWTDLNEPVALDPDGDGVPELEYPILDPAAFDPGPSGERISGAELVTNGTGFEARPGTDARHPLPMPVRWLYVLQDGTLTAGTPIDGNRVSLPGASRENPVTGRIAFWTDDECAKVNINTAGEGLYWDVPRTNGDVDGKLFANRQPVRNEFARYPGHPATVSLSAVLDPWIGMGRLNQASLADTPPAATLRKLQIYHSLAPGITSGGSNGGLSLVNPAASGGLPQPLIPDRDRLYATIDELLLRPDRGFQPEALPFSRQMLDQVKFFLTPHSRAPEVNLFGKPRIALWPIQQNASDRNVLDRLIAFCASTGSQAKGYLPFYFQRQSTHQKNISDPAQGSGSSQSPHADWTGIPRNQDLYAYLQKLTSSAIPGFGGRFDSSQKYGNGSPASDRDQILTQMMDFIRSGVNTYAIAAPNGPGSNRTYAYAPPRELAGHFPLLSYGESQIIPLRVNATKGFGRTVTVTEAALVFYGSRTAAGANQVTEAEADIRVRVPSAPDQTQPRWGFAADQMRAFLLLEFFCPMTGTPPMSPFLAIDMKSDVAVNGNRISFPTNSTDPVLGDVSRMMFYTPVGFASDFPSSNGDGLVTLAKLAGYGHSTAHTGFSQFFRGGGWYNAGNVFYRNVNSPDAWSGCPWHSAAISIPVPEPLKEGEEVSTMPTFSFGGPLTLSIKTWTGSDEIQRINLEFPQTDVQVPYCYLEGTRYREPPERAAVDPKEILLDERISPDSNYFHFTLIRPGDIVRSVEADSAAPPKGDFRLYAGRQNVPANWFRAGGDILNGQPTYFDPAWRFAHGLRSGNWWQHMGHFNSEPAPDPRDDAVDNSGGWDHFSPYYRTSTHRLSGSLVQGIGNSWKGGSVQVDLYRDAVPVTARGVEYAARADGQPGDWDNGFGNVEDGPYLNKPDEDNAAYTVKAFWAPNEDAGGYYSRGRWNADASGLNNAPNRQIASAVQFGSLPTGVLSDRPWETLLFCPNPAGRTTPASGRPNAADHRGFEFPRDHLLLDFFWMPVVEPYAVSEPFSTAGKINMNYEIMPFGYIKRRTGLHAVLKHTGMSAIHAAAASWKGSLPPGVAEGCYKGGRNQTPHQIRYDIDTNPNTGTLLGFERRFKTEGDLFRSASEICEIFLVPEMCENPDVPYPPAATSRNASYDTMMEWWNGSSGVADAFELTGDNSREAPYGQIYPRLTTKSNVFQVHYRVQSLQKVRSGDPAVWDETRDRIVGEQRGSATFERYLDQADAALPDLADTADFDLPSHNLDRYYRYRVIQRRAFSP